ncbi:MAG: NAD(P)/FAD-dependent oxidoreductase [Anaerococcus sp.]|nr:NAD(P)/FAD-dependent oxidoreductase [Anaerococcus sp.]
MYDSIIIGAGVSGTSVAYNLSKKEGKFLLIEKNEDVCTETSKANSAIMHGGYDAKPGTMKAKMNVLGNQMSEELSKKLNFPYKKIGTIVICKSKEDFPKLQKLYDQGIENGVKGLKILYHDELKALDENLIDDVYAGLYCKEAGIVDPFLMNVAFGEVAYMNGVEFNFNEKVEGFEKKDSYWLVKTNKGTYETKSVVNAAGVYADTLHNMVSDEKINIIPRRGEYILLDKQTKGFVNHVIFNVPSDRGKGVLVTPTIDGNTLVGPSSNFIIDKEDTQTTRDQLAYISRESSYSMKNIPLRDVITSFSGLRAHEQGDDFILKEVVDGFFDVAGIESPGLSSAPAIGQYMAGLVNEKLDLDDKKDFIDQREPMVKTSELSIKDHQDLIEKDPNYGQIICRCEKVTEGEIIDAIRRPLGARSIDGIKRRTRATAGRCQGGFCSPKLIEILARELGKDPSEINKNNENSYLLTGESK